MTENEAKEIKPGLYRVHWGDGEIEDFLIIGFVENELYARSLALTEEIEPYRNYTIYHTLIDRVEPLRVVPFDKSEKLG